MPLLRYFLIVGAILTCGLFALSTYLEPVASDKARASVARSNTALLVFAPAEKPPK